MTIRELSLRADCERADSLSASRCSETCVAISLLDADGLVYAQAHFPIEMIGDLIGDLARSAGGPLGRFH